MFDLSKITSVYSGRKGCACGCRGKYSYASAFKSERPSYCEGDEWVNDRTVKLIAAKVDHILREQPDWIERIMIDPEFFAIDLKHDRCYTLYFTDHNPRHLPTRIAEIDINPDCVVILEPPQDADGHAEILAHWQDSAQWLGWFGDDPLGDHHGRNV